MAEDILGLDFAIHGGGSDLVFPHHENEIAQTEAARGAPLARIWMHNGMVQMADQKMSKSEGNIFQLSEAIDRYGPEAMVAYLVSGHYRQPIAFGAEALEEARASAERIRNYAREAPAGDPDEFVSARREQFLDALADDFNTPRAIAAVFELVAEGNRRELPGARGALEELLPLLGLEALLRGGRAGGPRGRAPARRARERPLRARLRARRPDPRRARAARLGGPRHRRGRAPRAARLAAPWRSEFVYGRNAVAEARKGRRRVHRVLTPDDLPPEELTAAGGLAGPPGRGRRGRPVSLRERGRAARARRRG